MIATRNRANPLRECLMSLARQTILPEDIIIVDASDDDLTKQVCTEYVKDNAIELKWFGTNLRSAALQRNLGASVSGASFIVFLDDDVVLECEFIEALLKPLLLDEDGRLGGVGGTIVNEIPAPFSRLNRFLHFLIVGRDPHLCAGMVIGPAVHIPYQMSSLQSKPVQWLPSGACAYRRDIFLKTQFAPSFQGYSFMEDVELSSRVHATYQLVQACGARLYHKGLGSVGHTDWVAHGKSRLLNRHFVMVHALGKVRLVDFTRLFAYEMLYTPLAGIWNGGRFGSSRRSLLTLIGAIHAGWIIVCGRSPHGNIKPMGIDSAVPDRGSGER